jgi:hypothetical protein
MRYYAATTDELNQLADMHRNLAMPITVLAKPPTSLGQVLAWLDDLRDAGCLPTYPTNEQFRAAEALPQTTTLRGVLEALGADMSAF